MKVRIRTMRFAFAMMIVSLAIAVGAGCSKDEGNPTDVKVAGSLSGTWFLGGYQPDPGCDEQLFGENWEGWLMEITQTGNVVKLEDISSGFGGSIEGAIRGDSLTITNRIEFPDYLKTEEYVLLASERRDSLSGEVDWCVEQTGWATCCATEHIEAYRISSVNCADIQGIWSNQGPFCLPSGCEEEIQTITLHLAQEHCVFAGMCDFTATSCSYGDHNFWGEIHGSSMELYTTWRCGQRYLLAFEMELTSANQMDGFVRIVGQQGSVAVSFVKQ